MCVCLTIRGLCFKNSGASHQLHGARSDPRLVRLRRPLQPGGGGALPGQRGQPQPTPHPGTAAGHSRRTAQIRSGKNFSRLLTRLIGRL